MEDKNDQGIAGQGIEQELKGFLIDTLSLEEVTIEEIDSQTTLFGEGLGLDSVDALELGVALQKTYGVKVDPKAEETTQAFHSIKTLASFVARNRTK